MCVELKYQISYLYINSFLTFSFLNNNHIFIVKKINNVLFRSLFPIYFKTYLILLDTFTIPFGNSLNISEFEDSSMVSIDYI